jgi:elongation factor Ts
MPIDAKQVMKLRNETGAGAMECKKALEESGGDEAKARKWIQAKGLAKTEKLGGREAKEGWIGQYVHNTGKVAALVEVNCNTDFTARNEEFQALVRELAIAVVAFNPEFASKDQVPAALLDEEKKKYDEDVKGKKPEIAAKILEGKLDKNFFAQKCLLSMPFPKEDQFKGTYGEFVKALSAKTGENIVLRRFVRMELGA